MIENEWVKISSLILFIDMKIFFNIYNYFKINRFQCVWYPYNDKIIKRKVIFDFLSVNRYIRILKCYNISLQVNFNSFLLTWPYYNQNSSRGDILSILFLYSYRSIDFIVSSWPFWKIGFTYFYSNYLSLSLILWFWGVLPEEKELDELILIGDDCLTSNLLLKLLLL